MSAHCKYRCLVLLAALRWLAVWLLSILSNVIQFTPPNNLSIYFPFPCKEIVRKNIIIIFLLSSLFKNAVSLQKDQKCLEHVDF